MYQEGTGLPPDIAAVSKTSVHLMLSTPAMQTDLIREQGDVAVRASRWWKAGDGSVSLRLVDSKGHTLRGVQCGGRLFIAGTPGDHSKVLVRNELDIPMTVDVSVHGGSIQKLSLAPHASSELPFEFQTVSGVDAIHRYDGGQQRGVIDVDVFPCAARQRLLPNRPMKLPVAGPPMRTSVNSMPFRYR
jgi:hypothetical protein